MQVDLCNGHKMVAVVVVVDSEVAMLYCCMCKNLYFLLKFFKRHSIF